MFDQVRTNLFAKANQEKDVKDMNIFEKEMFKEEHKTFSANGSIKYDTTGNIFLDDFANLGKYKKPRDIKEVFDTMATLWSKDPLTCLKETVYLRIITRETKLLDGKKLSKQIGQGLKAEFRMRLMWLATYQRKTFYKNLGIFIAAGSWNDLIELMRIDLTYVHDNNPYKRVLDWKKLINFICVSIAKDDNGLILKYLPQIKSAKNCKTLRNQCNNYIAKAIAKELFKDIKEPSKIYAQYRKLKSSGNAHDWQKLISQQRYDEINFDNISGRALSILSNSNFLENHNLDDKFYNWILSKPTAKFTGFPYELFEKDLNKKYQQELVNRQFMNLLKDTKIDSNLLACIDISGSMTGAVFGTNSSAYSIAKSMALYFSYMLKGRFNNTFLTFSDDVTMQTWKGDTPVAKFNNFHAGYFGSTNFLGVAETLNNLLAKGYPESEFPTGVICISDGEFNHYSQENGSTFDVFKRMLLKGGFSKEYVDNFQLILWDIPNIYYGDHTVKFEGVADQPNYFYMSGLDPAGLEFLTGTKVNKTSAPKTAEELFNTAMNQELLLKLII